MVLPSDNLLGSLQKSTVIHHSTVESNGNTFATLIYMVLKCMSVFSLYGKPVYFQEYHSITMVHSQNTIIEPWQLLLLFFQSGRKEE